MLIAIYDSARPPPVKGRPPKAGGVVPPVFITASFDYFCFCFSLIIVH